jgi:GT2 family glycosyltransferase
MPENHARKPCQKTMPENHDEAAMTMPGEGRPGAAGAAAVRGPELSVVLAAADGYDSVRRTVAHLRAQTARDRIELVLVLPPGGAAADAAGLADFPWLKLVECPPGSVGGANAAGVRQASAPVVVLAEDHCFPEPAWAEALLQAHREDWVAVGPVVRNANPATAVSWADFFIGYGPWMPPADRREADFLPGHNCSYKRAVLLGYAAGLAEMLEAETVLHWDLRRRGLRLLLEPAAVVAHTNFSLWRSWLPVQYYAGRLFAGSRARGMPGWKRLLYVVGAPLIPLVRLARIARQAVRARLSGRFLASLHALAAGLALDGLGQFMGYLAGAGAARERVARYEYRRVDHVTGHDRRHVFHAEP